MLIVVFLENNSKEPSRMCYPKNPIIMRELSKSFSRDAQGSIGDEALKRWGGEEMGLIERIRRWWLEGYSDYPVLLEPGFDRQSEMEGRLTLETKPSESRDPEGGDSGATAVGVEEETPLEEESLEQKPLEPLEQETLEQREDVRTLEPPTQEQLKALKKALGLTHGSLQYKKRGDGIYHVVWNKDTKKHEWIHLGSWLELKAKLTE